MIILSLGNQINSSSANENFTISSNSTKDKKATNSACISAKKNSEVTKENVSIKKKTSLLKNIILVNNGDDIVFKINDRVNIDLDFEIVQSLQLGHGSWHEDM